jgi:hypothetical protein
MTETSSILATRRLAKLRDKADKWPMGLYKQLLTLSVCRLFGSQLTDNDIRYPQNFGRSRP